MASMDEVGPKITLSRPVCAIQLLPKEVGAKLGPLRQLRMGTTVELCGDGYNDRTKKVRVDGQCFFVFCQDLEAGTKAASA